MKWVKLTYISALIYIACNLIEHVKSHCKENTVNT